MSSSDKALMPDTASDDGNRVSWSGIVYTVLLLALITAALHIDSILMSLAVVTSAAAVAGIVHRCLPESPILPLVLANAIGVYACAFVFVVEILFPETGDLAAFVSYLIPLVGFTAGLLVNRDPIHVSDRGIEDGPTWDGGSIWCGLSDCHYRGQRRPRCMSMGSTTSFPRSPSSASRSASVVVAYVSSQTIADAMTETGDLFRDFFATIRELVQGRPMPFSRSTFCSSSSSPAFTASSTHISIAPHFSIQGEVRDIRFLEAIYFSLITFSTVGYGDMAPVSHAARIVVTIQVLIGVVLTLFGFFAIMNYRTDGK